MFEAVIKAAAPAAPDPRALLKEIAAYREPVPVRSVFELAITVVPFVLLWVAIWASIDAGYWIGLLLAIPAAGFMLRLFLIQHDCGHGSFFRRRATNDWVGRVMGVLTLTPYDYWRRSHAMHHANAGNLDTRGIGDIDTLTVSEFRALSASGRFWYRVYRNPVVLFGIGPAYQFLLRHRLPLGLMRSGWQPWASVMATNVATALLVVAIIWMVGLVPFLIIQVPITLIAATVGVWLFYVQHQFEDTSWDRADDWTFHNAALHGSSHYDLPAVLRWFTANIGIHHVHHLASRIPYYRLPEVLRDKPELGEINRLTLLQSFKAVRLVLWDEERRGLVSFRDARMSFRDARAAA